MEEALEMARAKDTKERMAGVERLHHYLEAARKPLSQSEATALVDCCTDLLKDPNFRIAQGALHAVASAAALSGDHLKLHFNALVPAAVERLGDSKQPVRDAAHQLLITLMEVSSPTIIVERAGAYGWAHRSWRVREEFLRTVTSAVGLFASTELTLPRVLLPHVLELLSDQNRTVREAAVLCIKEMYVHVGQQFHDELQRHNPPLIMVKEITARLEQIEPKVRQSNVSGAHPISTENKSLNLNQKRSSPKAKRSPKETHFSGGETDTTEKPVDAIKVYSEKELVREIEKIMSTLIPEKDWSVRITAMQRVEGLVIGGAVEYPSFPVLLKQLIAPLSIQLSDRRSSVVKQVCHLLCFLSKELLGDFEACAEMFIPVLFKLLVITVLVIAESADNCIKMMLRNCKVARVLPRIADAAKNERSAILRARCCEYSLLILEYWADAPEIQRSADLYEDFIKCCVADAMSEVRSTARACYRMFLKTWPERSRRLFVSFDPVIQRMINDEDGGIHKRYTSPSIRERGTQFSSNPSHGLPSRYGTSAIVPMDKHASSASEISHSPDSIILSKSVSQIKSSERNLESMLNASKQKVSDIENLLRGINISDKQNSSIPCSTSSNLVDPPSARDPPFPSAVPASNYLSLGDSLLDDSSVRVGLKNVDTNLTGFCAPRIQASKGSSILPYIYNLSSDSLSLLSLPSEIKASSERALEGIAMEANTEVGSTGKISGMQIDRHIVDRPHNDTRYRNSPNSYVPNFQRPLLRKQVTGRASASGRRGFDENQILVVSMSRYMDGPFSLSDALAEGFSPSSDWLTRIYAFHFIRTLLKQGPKGIQDVMQSFEKVMKLFFQHLDDPHHKIAQAALLALADIIPACRKPFEHYLERILPHVFSRLVDPKESVRQTCSATLQIIGRTYVTDSLLPAFVRSLDDQRSPKAKLAVIEFANNSFNKHVVNSDGYSNSGFLKLWLAKLAPLVNDKNMKLKDASISGIISVYSHFDSASVLNFIVSLSLEEQNSLRRALKQYTPRIEVDLVNFLQSKKERQRSKPLNDQSDVVGTSYEEGYYVMPKKGHLISRHSGDSVNSENGNKWNTTQESAPDASAELASFTKTQEQNFQSTEQDFNAEIICPRGRELKNYADPGIETTDPWTNRQETTDNSTEHGNNAGTPMLDIDKFVNCYQNEAISSVLNTEYIEGQYQNNSFEAHSQSSNEPGIPQLLHWVCNDNGGSSSLNKHDALQKLVKASSTSDYSIWTKYFNQILTAVLGALDDPDSSIRELSVSLVSKMLTNQKEAMENSIEIVIEKLLHVTKDRVAKVSNDAHRCLTTVLAQYDKFRCLDVVVPLLVSNDEETLVTCINFLTKLVGQLSQEELMIQLPSFIPSLFDAFRNQSPDVRKCVVLCLVDIYILLGKVFLPYLEGLSGTQLRLVTIYASRISEARSVLP